MSEYLKSDILWLALNLPCCHCCQIINAVGSHVFVTVFCLSFKEVFFTFQLTNIELMDKVLVNGVAGENFRQSQILYRIICRTPGSNSIVQGSLNKKINISVT